MGDELEKKNYAIFWELVGTAVKIKFTALVKRSSLVTTPFLLLAPPGSVLGLGALGDKGGKETPPPPPILESMSPSWSALASLKESSSPSPPWQFSDTEDTKALSCTRCAILMSHCPSPPVSTAQF